MDEFTLKIQLGNDAMQTPGDVAKTLRDLADKLDTRRGATAEHASGNVRDENGNTVGHWEFS
jgi:hypothetical protein